MSDLPLTGARAVLEGIDEFVGDVARMEGALEGNNTALNNTATASGNAAQGTDELNGKLGGLSSLLKGDVAGAFSGFLGTAALGGTIAIAGLVVNAIGDMAAAAGDFGGTIDDMAYMTGASTEDISDFVVALGAVGIETSALTPAFRTFNNGMLAMQQAMEEGVPPTGAFAEALDRIGVSAFDNEGNLRDFVSMFPEIADGLNALPAGAERSAIAMDIFGRSAQGLGDILEKGSDGISDLMKRADELGLQLSGPEAQRAEDYQQSVSKVQQSWESIKIGIGTAYMPALTELADSVDNLIRGSGSLNDVTRNVLNPGLAAEKQRMEEAKKAAADLALALTDLGTSTGTIVAGIIQEETNAAIQEGFWAQQADARTNILRNGNQALADMILVDEQVQGVVVPTFETLKDEANQFRDAVVIASDAMLQMAADAIVGVGIVTENLDRLIESITKTGEASASSLLSSANGILTEADKIAEMGSKFPKEDLENFIGQVGRLREIIAMSDLTAAQQAAILAMLDAAEAKAREATGVVTTAADEAGKAVQAAGETGASGWQDAKNAALEAGDAMDSLTSTPYHVTITWDKPPPEYQMMSPKTGIQHALENLQNWVQANPIALQWPAAPAGIMGGRQQPYLGTAVAAPQTVVIERDARSYTANFTPAGPMPSAGSVQDSFLAMRLGGW